MKFDDLKENQGDLVYLLYALFETGNLKLFSTLFYSKIKELEMICDTSKIYGYMGLYLYSKGKYFESKKNFVLSLKREGVFSQSSKEWIKVLQLDCFEPHSIGYLNYYFGSKITQKQRRDFIKKYTRAYNRITKWLPNKHNKKIDVFVFSNWKDNIGNGLSYANRQLATIHVNIDDDEGHELTHILCRGNINIPSRFVDEGIAEYFDGLIRGYEVDHVYIPPRWKNLFYDFSSLTRDVAYLLARIFIACTFKYYEGSVQKTFQLLELMFKEGTIELEDYNVDVIYQNVEKVFNRLSTIKRKGKMIYVQKKDLFDIDTIQEKA